MSDIIMSWPRYDRAIVGAILAGPVFAPWAIVNVLGHIRAQNERVIDLLFQIKEGRRD